MFDLSKAKINFQQEKLFRYRCIWNKFSKREVEKTGMPFGQKKLFSATGVITAAIVACVVIFGLIIASFYIPKSVTVEISDAAVTRISIYKTTCRRVDDFIKNNHIDYAGEQDGINVDINDQIENQTIIRINKPFKVSVTADGSTACIMTLPKTVGEILADMGTCVNEKDIVEPNVNHQMRKADEIIIRRVKEEYTTERKETDFKTRYEADSSLAIGKTQLKQEGHKGVEERTFLIVYADDEKISSELVSSEIVQEKRDRIISYGTKILSGVPDGLEYSEKYTDVRAVSYHYDGNPIGAYGLKCEYGTCAVDKNLIPLGSLLYIEGYGYAVANDVGSAIKGKTVDLYMERMAQCGIWGARETTVYVIEQK